MGDWEHFLRKKNCENLKQGRTNAMLHTAAACPDTYRDRGSGGEGQHRHNADILVLVPVLVVKCEAALRQGVVVCSGRGIEQHSDDVVLSRGQLQAHADGGRLGSGQGHWPGSDIQLVACVSKQGSSHGNQSATSHCKLFPVQRNL